MLPPCLGLFCCSGPAVCFGVVFAGAVKYVTPCYASEPSSILFPMQKIISDLNMSVKFQSKHESLASRTTDCYDA